MIGLIRKFFKFFQRRRAEKRLTSAIKQSIHIGPSEGPGRYSREIKPKDLDGSMHTLAHYLNQQRIKANEQESQQSVEDNDP